MPLVEQFISILLQESHFFEHWGFCTAGRAHDHDLGASLVFLYSEINKSDFPFTLVRTCVFIGDALHLERIRSMWGSMPAVLVL